MKPRPQPLLFLPLALLVLAACGGGGKKPPPSTGDWRQGPLDLAEAPAFKQLGCSRVRQAGTLEWSPSSGLPDHPGETLVLLSPGHGPAGNRPPYDFCYRADGSKRALPTVAGKNTLAEDELTMALALRLRAFLKRLGFRVELIRYGEYGTEGECPQKALFRKSPLVLDPENDRLFCDNRYLAVRGRSDRYPLGQIIKLCAGDKECIADVLLSETKSAISRAGQLVRDHAAELGIAYDPGGDNYVNSPRVAYISLHFNAVAGAGDDVGTMLAMFSGTVRVPETEDRYQPNPALTTGSGDDPLSSVSQNYVTSLFEYLFHSLRARSRAAPGRVLPEAEGKRVLVYQNLDLINPQRARDARPYSFSSDDRDGPLYHAGDPIRFHVNPPNKLATGTVTVVTGFEPYLQDYQASKRIITIPNNVTLEVAHYLDCRNAVPLLESLVRPATDPDFDADRTPLSREDPLDVAAEDIAHGLVAYYASYVPAFKEAACQNLRTSDWADLGWPLPDWCRRPDIDAVNPGRFQAAMRVGESRSATLSFENVGDGDLIYRVRSDPALADLGPPRAIPAGNARPLAGEQSGTLAPQHRAEVPVTLRCPSEGTHTGSVVIESNDPDEGRIELPVELTCDPPPTLELKALHPPEVTAFNYLLPANAGWGAIPNDVFDFREAGGKTELHYRLTLPDWLRLSPTEGVLPPGGHFLDLVSDNAEALCDAVGEKNDVIVIESDDPQNPRVEVPVRLMCAELEVAFQPDRYNGPEVPVPERCPPLTGTIRVRGAPHLKEMYAEISGDAVRYRLPEFTYLVEHANYTTRRWPILHAPGDPQSPWDWSYYPEFAFQSFVQSCAFETGDHTVRTFDLVHPAWRENPPNPRSTYGAHLAAPTGFTVLDNRFPGIVYDYARRCDDQGNCTEYDAEINLSAAGFSDQRLALSFNQWGWMLEPLAATFQEDVYIKQGTSTVASGFYHLGPLFDPVQLRYCRILRTDRLRDHQGNYLTPPGMPPVYWGQTVEWIEDPGTPGVWLVQAMHEPICFQPWDPGAGPRPSWKSGSRAQPLGIESAPQKGFRLLFDPAQ